MIKIRKYQYILTAAVLSATTVSISKEISYDYIQGGYMFATVDTNTSVGDLDGKGFGISGSFSIAPNVALAAGFGSTSFDEFLGVDFDTTELFFGVTGHFPVAYNTDIFGNFSVIKVEIELSDGFVTIDDDDTGNIISIGLRHLATDSIELSVGFGRVDVFDETDTSFSIGASFYVNDKFSLGVGYAAADDVEALSLSARIDFK